jgi:16S rRNA (uracil1498-N3)-methyltransferase
MQLFYCPDLYGDFHILSEEESKHIVRVLRLTIGDFVHLTDGKGGMFKAELTDNHSKRVSVKIVKKLEHDKKAFHLHMAVAPTKSISRYEWFLEKATEIGIDKITPIICEHSERKKVNTNRLERIILAAVKQSLKAYFPKLEDSIKFKEFIKQDFNGQKFIAYCNDEPKALKDLYTPKFNTLILIGPEGDFSPEEVKLAHDNGFIPVNLGPSRLRTETAAIIACHTINFINQ